MNTPRRSGRRPGNPATREAILAAAREAFAAKGYGGASLRAIAADANVDPGLVRHYFGTKDKLFLASVNAPFDPADLIPQLATVPRTELGAHLVRVILGIWDSPAGADALALLRSGMTNDTTANLVRDFVQNQILRNVLGSLGLDEHETPVRAGLVATQLVGMAVVRYVFRLEPIASTPADQLAETIGPTVQHYLTGPLPGTSHSPTKKAEKRP